MTSFIEESYVIAPIMATKLETLGENFVTFRELNIINNKFQELFDKNNVFATMVSGINSNHYSVSDGIIRPNRDNRIDIEIIKNIYQEYLPLELVKYLWDKEFICECLYELRKDDCEQLKQGIQKVKKINN